MEESCFFIYVYLNGLRANRLYENLFIFSQEPYRAVNSDRDLATLFCVHEKCSMTARVRISVHNILGGGVTGVASLVMFSQRRTSEDCDKIPVQDWYSMVILFLSWILADLVDLDDLPDAA